MWMLKGKYMCRSNPLLGRVTKKIAVKWPSFFRDMWNAYFIFRELWQDLFNFRETWSRSLFTTLNLERQCSTNCSSGIECCLIYTHPLRSFAKYTSIGHICTIQCVWLALACQIPACTWNVFLTGFDDYVDMCLFMIEGARWALPSRDATPIT